jgi:hypothetical protein
METEINVKPLPYKKRQTAFLSLLGIFLISLPFLYLYATGYRFDFKKPTNLVSTGGMYIAVDRIGAEIYIDGELVRETRTFRKAFYAQNLDSGTHRVHVQKEGSHTWVKELPVSKRLVTEAEAFNLPLAPQVRVIAAYQSATGTMIVSAPLHNASSTNEVLATTTKMTSAFTKNPEYELLMLQFGTTTSTSTAKISVTDQIKGLIEDRTATTTENSMSTATTTLVSGGVKLYESGEDLFATWIGNFEQMPYYYCAPDFPRYSTSSPAEPMGEFEERVDEMLLPAEEELTEDGGENALVMHPVQTVPTDSACDPTIRIDRRWQDISHFDFLPGSTDLVIVVFSDGIYVVEIDDRSWQNAQPLFKGSDLRMHIENGNIYVYDGELIYQVIIPTE